MGTEIRVEQRNSPVNPLFQGQERPSEVPPWISLLFEKGKNNCFET